MIFYFFLSILVFTGFLFPAQASADSLKQNQTLQSEATPDALEKQFVSFKPHLPLMPGSLDLFGYEREKIAKSYPVISPDKSHIAVTEIFFQPATRQTYGRIALILVGAQPALADIVTTEKLQEMEEEKEKNRLNNPSYIPQVKLQDVNPNVFWERYQPEKHLDKKNIILEAGFDRTNPYRVDLVQVADWSQDGSLLLMIYRPGVHHLGIQRTIPIIYDLTKHETVRLTHLPQLVWSDQIKRLPELTRKSPPVWDIRPLGWSSQNPSEFIVKLVIFEGQSEISSGFWSYSLKTAMLRYLGSNITDSQVARNGWIARFVDPTATGGSITYEPGQAPPPKTFNSSAKKRGWFGRLQFWKK